jgi:hypothetical protein
MSKELATKQQAPEVLGSAIEQVLIAGDLSKLTSEQRVSYYNKVCESLGLNPLTRPFEYITLSGKLTFYARKDCTEQLRNSRKVSVGIVSREVTEGVYVVTAHASDASGRSDESIGAVPIDKLTGEARANAFMKAETKAKRRVTLSFCGLGMLDETETETESIPGATFPSSAQHREVKASAPLTAELVDAAKASKAQITALCAAMTNLGIKDRPAVLAWINERIAPRKVESRLDLTPDEASKCIELARPQPVDDRGMEDAINESEIE